MAGSGDCSEWPVWTLRLTPWRHPIGPVYNDQGMSLDVEHSSMKQPKAKERVLEAVRDLPDDATVEDVMERLYFLAKVEEGLRQAEAGETVSHEEAKRRILG